MAQPNSTQGVAALANLFRVIDQNGHVPSWYDDKAKLVWARYQSPDADGLTIPGDRETLNIWLNGLK